MCTKHWFCKCTSFCKPNITVFFSCSNPKWPATFSWYGNLWNIKLSNHTTRCNPTDFIYTILSKPDVSIICCSYIFRVSKRRWNIKLSNLIVPQCKSAYLISISFCKPNIAIPIARSNTMRTAIKCWNIKLSNHTRWCNPSNSMPGTFCKPDISIPSKGNIIWTSGGSR